MEDDQLTTHFKLTREEDTGKFNLTRQEGSSLKDLINEHYLFSFPKYCAKVAMHPSNVYAVLSGERGCTIEWLNRFLSGIGFEAKCRTELVIQALPTGQTANDVDYTQLEEESLSDETLQMDDNEFT